MVAGILPKVRMWIEQPSEKKLEQSRSAIRRWYDPFMVNDQDYDPELNTAVAFSGGKDSTATLALVREYHKGDLSTVNVVFNNTGVEYPETVKFVHELQREWGFNLVELKPKTTFWKLVDEYGYPVGKEKRPGRDGTTTDNCCYHLKEKPMMDFVKENGIKIIYLGITALESHQRMIKASTHGDCYVAKKWGVRKVLPILYWSEGEVWNYLKENNIPTNPIYQKKGIDRCGCMPCTAHKLWKEQICLHYPSLCSKILREIGQSQLPMEVPA